jgi:hypothetical protein
MLNRKQRLRDLRWRELRTQECVKASRRALIQAVKRMGMAADAFERPKLPHQFARDQRSPGLMRPGFTVVRTDELPATVDPDELEALRRATFDEIWRALEPTIDSAACEEARSFINRVTMEKLFEGERDALILYCRVMVQVAFSYWTSPAPFPHPVTAAE